MKKIRLLLIQPFFHFFLFLFSLMLFNWPIISIAEIQHSMTLFSYLFYVWGVIIFVLFLISRSLSKADSD